ncbi:MAG: RIP metalloprotease RseP [Porphyromonas sp.]|nr:RIP metalloprotease RseP [Porphyromonas sp.]
MTVLIKALQLLLALSLLVFIHELGHFVFARLFKIRVNKFYLFFDWKFALWRYKPKKSDTEYGIGWIPLGGYCQIDGMVDESLATDGLESDPKPWEFRSKPIWQRFLVMIGGVLFNVILAMLIYGGIAYTWGTDRMPMEVIGDNLQYSSVGHQMGLKDGDLPLSVDGKELKYFEGSIIQTIANGKQLTVLRDGEQVELTVPRDLIPAIIGSDSAFFMLDVPARVDSVIAGSEGELAGFRPGDLVLAVNGEETKGLSKVIPAIHALRGDSILVTVDRGGALETIKTYTDEESGIGIAFTSPANLFPSEHQSYNFITAIPAGISEAYKQLFSYADQLKYVATPQGASSLGGLGSIGNLFPSSFDWHVFWNMTAFLSIILAVMNLLPIPGLDGGHIIFLIYEAIVRRPPSLKWQTRIQTAGMILLLILILYANIADIFRFLL